MAPTNVMTQAAVSPASPAGRTSPLAQGAFLFLGFVAPLLLIGAAFFVSPDILVRTRLIIEGLGLIVAALAALTVIAAANGPAALAPALRGSAQPA